MFSKVLRPSLRRGFATSARATAAKPAARYAFAAVAFGGAVVGAGLISQAQCDRSLRTRYQENAPAKLDWAGLGEKIEEVIEKNDAGPLFVRLAWHAAGTYSKYNKDGGSMGATMRYSPESEHGANAGLDKARQLLAQLTWEYPSLSTADLWAFAGCVAIASMGGPKVDFRPGRTDGSCDECTPDGRLPDATQGSAHLRDIFYRMGFDDKDIVTLSGAHCLGECHADRSGFKGPWTFSPTTFSNLYYKELMERHWVIKPGSNPMQYMDAESGELMMLPTDVALMNDSRFQEHVRRYADSEDDFFAEFAVAFQKLMELGCHNLDGKIDY